MIINKELISTLNDTGGYAKIIAFYLDKGGTGKTSEAFNFAGFCADVLIKHLNYKRVLVIDGDRSCNISDAFGVKGKKTIKDVFETGDFDIYKTSNPNIDIIPGDELFTDEGVGNLKTLQRFADWLFKNQQMLDKEYAFIIIDTHNDKSDVTKNLIAASHTVVNVATPDANSYKALMGFDNFIENEIKPNTIAFRSTESFVDINKAVIANRISFKGNNVQTSTQEFLDDVQKLDGYLGLISERKIVSESLLIGESIFKTYQEKAAEGFKGMKDKEVESLKLFIEHNKTIFERIAIMACQKAKESV